MTKTAKSVTIISKLSATHFVSNIDVATLDRTKSDHFDLDNLGDDEFDVKIEGVSDPCTEAALFWGDQALSEDDVQDCLSFSQFLMLICGFIVHNSLIGVKT